VRLVCEWSEAGPPDRNGTLGQIRPGGVTLGASLAEAELVETAFMNIVWDLLIVDTVPVAVTIILSRGFDQ